MSSFSLNGDSFFSCPKHFSFAKIFVIDACFQSSKRESSGDLTGCGVPTKYIFFSLFVWDAYSYIGSPILNVILNGKNFAVCMGCVFHTVMSIFTVKMGTLMPIVT